MKMKNLSYTIALIVFVTISSCEKELPDEGVYFSTNVSETENIYTLYIDGKDRGKMAYFADLPSCSDKSNLTLVILDSGTHTFTIYDKDSNVESEGKFKVTSRSIEGDPFYKRLDQIENCIIFQYQK